MQQTGIYLFLLFGLSIFVSKAAVNIGLGLLILWFLIYVIRHRDTGFFTRTRYVRMVLIPIGIGLVLSAVSLAGISGVPQFLSRFRFLFLVLPFSVFITEEKSLIKVFAAMNIGALIDMTYSMINSDLSQPFENIYGLHKFGRHSDMLFTLFLVNTTFLFLKYKLRQISPPKWAFALLSANTLFLFITVVLIGQRGAYVGLFCGLVLLFFLYSKRLLAALIVLVLLSPLFAPDYVLQRSKSIFDTSELSNSVRIRLYRLGVQMIAEKNLYIRGTGAENIKAEVEKYLGTKTQATRDRYHDLLTQFPGNFHNSYLQMALEAGVLFLVLYLAALARLLWRMFITMRKTPASDHLILSCTLVCMGGYAVCSFFHEEFFRYGGLVAFICFYGGCMTLDRRPEPAAAS